MGGAAAAAGGRRGSNSSTGTAASASSSADNVQVFVRIRPPENKTTRVTWRPLDHETVEDVDDSAHKQFHFSRIFGDRATNEDVYKHVVTVTVQQALIGFNGTVFAYGQTNSGKTHTLTGTRTDPGLVPRAVQDVFRSIDAAVDKTFLLRVAFFEIYNENLRDLLRPEVSSLSIREKGGQFIIPDLTERIVTSPAEVAAVLKQGESNRSVGVSNLNEHSSRSHTIFRLIIESAMIADEADEAGAATGKQPTGAVTFSELNLVDLAGSESISDRFDGSQRRETKHINLSLTQLKTVIQALSRNDQHVPFRNSSLTKVLRNSLGGNARTSVICTASPLETHHKQTRMTLTFGELAKNIRNKPRVNEVVDENATVIQQYRHQITHLTKRLASYNELEYQKAKIQQDYENLVREMEALKSQQAERHALASELKTINNNVVSHNSLANRRAGSAMGSHNSDGSGASGDDMDGLATAQQMDALHDQLNPEVSVSVITHAGQGLVVIRETYQTADGRTRFGSEGIALSLENWSKLKAVMPHIDADIGRYVQPRHFNSSTRRFPGNNNNSAQPALPAQPR